MDVITAFLYVELQENVYMEQPIGFTDNNIQHICKLNRALYGLKQAPREWYNTLFTFLIELGFKRLESDYSVFIK